MRVKHDAKAYRDLLKSQAVLADLRARAKRVAAAAGQGFEYGAQLGRNRARAYVLTASNAARRRNSRENTLVRALEAGRGR